MGACRCLFVVGRMPTVDAVRSDVSDGALPDVIYPPFNGDEIRERI